VRQLEILRQAVATLRAHPMRSALGALAIAVAVATIVIVVTALDGVRVYTERTTARTFGSDTFVIAQVAAPTRVSRRELLAQLERNPPIQRPEISFLNRYRGEVAIYAPSAQRRSEVTAGALVIEDAVVNGTTASIAAIRQIDLSSGRFFDAREDQAGAAVAVIGADVASTLFPASSPTAIRLAGRRFDVVGVQTRVGSTGSGSIDKYVWIPLRAYERAFGAPRSYQVFARGADGVSPIDAEDRARVSLRAKRALPIGAPDNFDVLTPDAARGFVANLSQRIGVAAGPISLMALLAAVVVVTNTVLVSVTQRTREIGVRRALGATRRRIVQEVVAESVLLSILGGISGAAAATALMSVAGALSGLPLVVSAATFGWALVAAAGSGLAAAWYPARRATATDVIAAIRTE
jgi:putative ABC transport system permease protein